MAEFKLIDEAKVEIEILAFLVHNLRFYQRAYEKDLTEAHRLKKEEYEQKIDAWDKKSVVPVIGK